MFNVEADFKARQPSTAATAAKHHSVDLAVNQTRYFPEYHRRVRHRKGKPCRLVRVTESKSTLDTCVSEFEIVQVLLAWFRRIRFFRFTRLHCLHRFKHTLHKNSFSRRCLPVWAVTTVRSAKKNHAKQLFKKISVFESMFTATLMLSSPEASSTWLQSHPNLNVFDS